MSHPYSRLPDFAFWRSGVAAKPPREIDPVVAVPFAISSVDRVASAGSCFAQHISRYLRNGGFNYFVTEPAHPVMTEPDIKAFNYGTFTARYGNIYTARQLLQLLRRAYGRFSPADDVWPAPDDNLIDPFRPQIQPGGFSSLREFQADREKHFAAVRRAFEELDILVFTLGLTEAWRSRSDGAVYPLCPGVAGGAFDESKHEFHNFSVEETTSDMLAFIDELRARNSRAKLVLTVSPVPLIATAENRHVLVSTTYSKSVLRVACGQLAQLRENVTYFPSYEVITSNFNRGAYFAPDLRSVTEQGVSHVMRLFMAHFAGRQVEAGEVPVETRRRDSHSDEMAQLVALDCDEEALERGRRIAGRGKS